ncbi:unnamed protein product, partial [Ixodes pacificus]
MLALDGRLILAGKKKKGSVFKALGSLFPCSRAGGARVGDHGVSKRCVAFRGLVRSGETSNSRLLELPLRPAAIFWGDSVVIILGDAETGWTLFRRSPRLFWCLADRFGASSCSEEKVPPASTAGGVSGIP